MSFLISPLIFSYRSSLTKRSVVENISGEENIFKILVPVMNNAIERIKIRIVNRSKLLLRIKIFNLKFG
jgi:hypothetical protein